MRTSFDASTPGGPVGPAARGEALPARGDEPSADAVFEGSVDGAGETGPPAESLRPSALLGRTEGLHVRRRGDQALVIEPERPSWGVFSPPAWRCLQRLARPSTVAEAEQAAVADGMTGAQASSLLGQLVRQGFVRVDGRVAAAPAPMAQRPSGSPSFVAIHLLDGCNLRCAYCYAEPEGSAPPMEPALLRAIIDRVIAELASPSVTVDFLGGEPLLAFDALVDAVRYGRERAAALGRRVDFILQTNGTQLTRERARVLASLDVGVGVSIDGPQAIHDRRRRRPDGRGSWREVHDNLLAARDEGLRVAPLAVVEEPGDYLEVLRFFVDLGFEYVRFNHLAWMGRARALPGPAPDRAEALGHGFLEMARFAHDWCDRHRRRLRINDLNQMLGVLTSPRRDYMCMRSPCGMADAIISFGPRGEIYACEEVEQKTRDWLLLGRLDDRPLRDIICGSPNYARLKARRVDAIPRCSRCAWRHFCGGGCTHKSLAAFGSPLREDPSCRFHQVVLEELMWLIWEDPRVVENLGSA